MTVKSSGSLTFTEIETEWDLGSKPWSISELYAGGSAVYAGAEDGDGNDIPSSGNPISFSHFYDTTYFQPAGSNTTVTSSQTLSAPTGANALYVYRMVAGGGGGHGGLGYDKAGGENGGGGGAGGASASGHYIMGTSFYYTHGAGGSGGGNNYNSGFNQTVGFWW